MYNKSIIVVIFQRHELLNLNHILCFVLLFHAEINMERKLSETNRMYCRDCLNATAVLKSFIFSSKYKCIFLYLNSSTFPRI
jgi:hypothetical protein